MQLLHNVFAELDVHLVIPSIIVNDVAGGCVRLGGHGILLFAKERVDRLLTECEDADDQKDEGATGRTVRAARCCRVFRERRACDGQKHEVLDLLFGDGELVAIARIAREGLDQKMDH